MSRIYKYCDGRNNEKVFCLFLEFSKKEFRNIFRYYELCSEILSSVRKMEDSIQRLKRVRESSKALSNMTQSATAGSSEMTDDNKIRKQIQHDVDAFISEVNILTGFIFSSKYLFSLINSVLIYNHQQN